MTNQRQGRSQIKLKDTPFISHPSLRVGGVDPNEIVLHERPPIRLVNINSLGSAHVDTSYAKALRTTGTNFIDSAPLAWILSARACAPVNSTRGPSLFQECLLSPMQPRRHYLLGGSESTLAAIRDRVKNSSSAQIICGSASPPFSALSDHEMREQDQAIIRASPDIVWVGLGGLKQDAEAQRLTEQHNLLTVGVGAAFDFFAGAKQEAPKMIQNSGFEWLFRLSTEPRRLLPRYTIGTWRALRWLSK